MAAPRASSTAPPARFAGLLFQWANAVAGLAGWRAAAAASLAGALSTLAMAPIFASPVLLLTLPVLVWLIDGSLDRQPPATPIGGAAWAAAVRGGLRAGAVGWWFGAAYFFTGLFWIGEAFLVEAERFAWALPFAVTLMPAGLALFYGAAVGGAAALGWPAGPARALELALALSAAEWVRGHVLTGFPWNVLGYALTYPVPLMQSASILGIYGLTFWAVLIFGLPLVLLADAGTDPRRLRLAAAGAGSVLAALALMWAYGAARIAASGAPAPVDGVRLRLVQPSVPQREKWRPENQREIFLDHLSLSRQGPDGAAPGLAGITHLIWPEAAMPFLPLDVPEAGRAIGELLSDRVQLLAGALRLDTSSGSQGDASRRAFNSLIAFGPGGRPMAIYDKIHLVPFGEYLPLRGLLEHVGLEKLVAWRGGFSTGRTPRPLLHVPGLPPIGALICYEAIFPAAVVQGDERPQVLINVTNDGWFGVTTGPHQHFHQARVRAVEEGLPLVRVANNGITAVVDPEGRVLARLGLNERGVIDAPLPAARPPPPYARYGDAAFLAGWLLGLGGLVLAGRRRGAGVAFPAREHSRGNKTGTDVSD